MSDQPMSLFQPMTKATLPTSLAINLQYESVLSPLSLETLQDLIDLSCYARQTADGQAFLIAIDYDTEDDCENLNWFQVRYDNFIYVDRIVIGDAHQRQSLGQKFYQDLEYFARAKGRKYLCAEVNTMPPNPASHAFHQHMGFEAVGDVIYGDKAVRYYLKAL